MNVINSENHSEMFVNMFAPRSTETATSDLQTKTPLSAHDLAMAYQAAFAARKAVR